MVIQELTRQESLEVLARQQLGRLACARDGQPYVVPIYFTCHDGALYGFATVGRKIEWMRANPLVCVEVDAVESAEEWVSVVVTGRYEELPERPEWEAARTLTWTLLRHHAVWAEAAYAKTVAAGRPGPPPPIFYRIQLGEVTGHRATPAAVPPRAGWQRLVQRVRRSIGGRDGR